MFPRKALATLLLSLSLSVDGMAVGISYGLRRVRMRFLPLAVMLMGSTIAMTAAMDLAKVITAPLDETVTKCLSAALLTALGSWTLYRGWRECAAAGPVEEPEEATSAGDVNLWESFYLGLALGADDFAEAAGLATAGCSVGFTVVIFKLSELIMILVGSELGFHGVTKILRRRLRLVPGLVLMGVGLWQLV